MNVTDMTLNRLIEEFYQLTSKHKFIKTSFYGDFLNTVESEKVQHLSFLFNAVVGNISEKFITFNFTIAVMDKVFKDQSNRVDVESDSVQILSDIFSVITKSDRWLSFSRLQGATAPIQKFIGKGEDQVTGWSMTMQLGIMRTSGLCDLPIEGYDYEGAYTAFCAGVRIFQDGILVDVVPSGGRYDYSTGGGSIDIDVNGFAFYVGVSTNQNVEVVGTDDLPKGSVIAGPKLRIADSQITFNTAPVEPIPSELSKAVVVQTVDGNPTGDVIEDTSNSLKIEIQNSQVNVNGDGFESIPPDSVLNIPVVDETDVAVGTNTGTKIVVASSVVTLGTQSPADPLTPIRSQQNKTINLVDAIDQDPVQVIVATDTQSLADLIIPNGTVNLKDNLGNTLDSQVVKAGGVANKNISDFTTKKVYYNRPNIMNVPSYATYDEGWMYANNYDPPFNITDGVLQEIDFSISPDYLKYFNAFGHKFRLTGLNGGYYDFNTASYKDVNGDPSTFAAEFQTPVGATGVDGYCIDHLTGIATRTERGGIQTWGSALSDVAGVTLWGYSDWKIPTMLILQELQRYDLAQPLLNPNRPPFAWSQAGAWSCTTFVNNTLQAYFLNGNTITAGTKTISAANRTYSRIHYLRSQFVTQP